MFSYFRSSSEDPSVRIQNLEKALQEKSNECDEWKRKYEMTLKNSELNEDAAAQLEAISESVSAIVHGDLSKRVTINATGPMLTLKNDVNSIADLLNTLANGIHTFANDMSSGKYGVFIQEENYGIKGAGGVWKEVIDDLNMMGADLSSQIRYISVVTVAIGKGDLTRKVDVDAKGEMLELKNAVNTMVDQLNSFVSEITCVSREMGTEGKLGRQAQVRGLTGAWKYLTEDFNTMAANLTTQIRDIAEVTTAIARGDLFAKVTIDASGELLELKNTVNTMVDQLNTFASEITRVSMEIGTEGKFGGQAQVKGATGAWKDLTDNINTMAAHLTYQIRAISEVITAIAIGDLAPKMTIDVSGEILELKYTINTMMDQLSNFANEISRVSIEMGSEGKFGGQARVKGVAGIWRDLTNNINYMAANMTGQIRAIAEVTTAIASGDLSRKIMMDVYGETQELKNTINTMVDQLNAFASEVARVSIEMGTEGKFGGQAQVKGVGGTWKDLTDLFNTMAANMTGQIRAIAEVTTAIAIGDLSQKMTIDVTGEILELKYTINTMVDQLNIFANEVNRVSIEIGSEGKLGAQARVRGVAGVWKDLTENINTMAANMTGQIRAIADAITAIATGDLSRTITIDVFGEILELKNTINTMVYQFSDFASEVTRVSFEMGAEGKFGGQAQVKGVTGTWKDLTENVNTMAANLTGQIRNMMEVMTAIAKGDLSKKMTTDCKGEILQLKNTLNPMMDQLNSLTSEIIHMAEKVGTEKKLETPVKVPCILGIWEDLEHSVNNMALKLTDS